MNAAYRKVELWITLAFLVSKSIPRQQCLIILNRVRLRRRSKYVAQPHMVLLAVDLRFLDQAINLRTARGAFGRVAEEPRLRPIQPYSLLIIVSAISERPFLPFGCTFCASTNLRRAWAMIARRSTPGCNAKAAKPSMDVLKSTGLR